MLNGHGSPPSLVPILEDHPRLTYTVARRIGALLPGTAVYLHWSTPAGSLTVQIIGGDGAFTIHSGENQTRVVFVRAKSRGTLICPTCEASVRYILFRQNTWRCRHCSKCDYAIRHRRWPTIQAAMRRQRLLYRLARVADPKSKTAAHLTARLRGNALQIYTARKWWPSPPTPK